MDTDGTQAKSAASAKVTPPAAGKHKMKSAKVLMYAL